MTEHHPLSAVTARILEEWARTFVDPGPEAPSFDRSEELFEALTDFTGVIHGNLSIVCGRPLMRIIAANQLGLDADGDEIERDDQDDSLRELANVITGNFLTEAYGTDESFRVIPPSLSPCGEARLQEILRSKYSFSFLADDQLIVVSFLLLEVSA